MSICAKCGKAIVASPSSRSMHSLCRGCYFQLTRREPEDVPNPTSSPRVADARRRPAGGLRMWDIGIIGLHFHGRRDPRPDGSYLTTQWIDIGCLPLIPLATVRVRELGSYGTTTEVAHKYAILAEAPPLVKQVLSVYSWLGGLAAIVWTSVHLDSPFPLMLLIPWLPLPAVLRYRTTRRWG
jgi:hypothetical protein